MEMKNSLVLLLVLIAVAVVIGVVAPDIAGNRSDEPNGSAGEPVPVLTLVHTFNDGTHTASGVIGLPTPCHTLDHTVTVAESFPEQVTIHLETMAGNGACAQVITERGFTAEFDADENASLSVTFNGRRVPIELIEAVPDTSEE